MAYLKINFKATKIQHIPNFTSETAAQNLFPNKYQLILTCF